jgi:hypothetical protein
MLQYSFKCYKIKFIMSYASKMTYTSFKNNFKTRKSEPKVYPLHFFKNSQNHSWFLLAI